MPEGGTDVAMSVPLRIMCPHVLYGSEKVLSLTVSVVIHQNSHVLFVQERTLPHYGLWNLPGGHVEVGETIQHGARREVVEETGLHVTLSGLVGIYTAMRPPDRRAIRFVFTAIPNSGSLTAGHDILDVRWFRPGELVGLPDSNLVHPAMLRRIITDLLHNRHYPLETLVETPEPRDG